MTLAAHAHAKRPDGRARAPGRSLAGRALGHGHLQRAARTVARARGAYVLGGDTRPRIDRTDPYGSGSEYGLEICALLALFHVTRKSTLPR